jgi:hypothetical protein
MYTAIQRGWTLSGQPNMLRNFIPTSDDWRNIAISLKMAGQGF